MSKSNRFAMAALTGLLALAPAFAQSTGTSGSMGSSKSTKTTSTTATSTSKVSATDTRFIKEAAMGGMEEVQLGQLAVQKASNGDVKSFGQRMVDDHTKANSQLQQIASQKGVTVASKLSAPKQKDVDKLSKLNGAAFDRSYMSMMVKDHVKDVSDFQKASKNAKDSDVKSFASATLPTLQDHLKMAKDISSALNKKKSSSPHH
jgi:putative membrane protein